MLETLLSLFLLVVAVLIVRRGVLLLRGAEQTREVAFGLCEKGFDRLAGGCILAAGVLLGVLAVLRLWQTIFPFRLPSAWGIPVMVLMVGDILVVVAGRLFYRKKVR